MSHAFASLNEAKLQQESETEKAIELMWTRNLPREQARYARIAEQKAILLERMCLIGRMCVQYKLPSGDPCWLARAIGDFE